MQRQGLGGRGCVTNKQKKYKNAAKSKYRFSLHPTAEARGALSRRGNYFWREREGSAQPSPAAGGEAQKRAARPYPGADLRPRGRAGGRAVRTVQPSPHLSPRLHGRSRRGGGTALPQPPGGRGPGLRVRPFSRPFLLPTLAGKGSRGPTPGLRGAAVSFGAVEQLPLLGPRPVLRIGIPHHREEMRGLRGRSEGKGERRGERGAERAPRVGKRSWGAAGPTPGCATPRSASSLTRVPGSSAPCRPARSAAGAFLCVSLSPPIVSRLCTARSGRAATRGNRRLLTAEIRAGKV